MNYGPYSELSPNSPQSKVIELLETSLLGALFTETQNKIIKQHLPKIFVYSPQKVAWKKVSTTCFTTVYKF